MMTFYFALLLMTLSFSDGAPGAEREQPRSSQGVQEEEEEPAGGRWGAGGRPPLTGRLRVQEDQAPLQPLP